MSCVDGSNSKKNAHSAHWLIPSFPFFWSFALSVMTHEIPFTPSYLNSQIIGDLESGLASVLILLASTRISQLSKGCFGFISSSTTDKTKKKGNAIIIRIRMNKKDVLGGGKAFDEK